MDIMNKIVKFLETKIEEVKKKRRNMLRKNSWQTIGEPSELQAIADYLNEEKITLLDKENKMNKPKKEKDKTKIIKGKRYIVCCENRVFGIKHKCQKGNNE